VQGNEGQFLATYFCYILCLWKIIYANSLFLLGMPDGDAMKDIVDELGEDEITEESYKYFSFFHT
jgi:hypothetical protein